MTTANRIRVLIAGNVYVKRALVRRFLEDDGYEVVGDVMTAEAVIPAIQAGRPDAVVLDGDLATQGASVAAIRAAAPDTRVIVFTATAPRAGTPPPGADGYLDKGVGLSALTAMLGRLFAEPTTPLEPPLVPVGVPAATPDDTPEVSMDDTKEIEPTPAGGSARGPVGNVYRIVAMVAGALLIVWGVAAAIGENGGGGDTQTAAEPSAAVDTGGDIIAEPETTSALDEAYATLDRMIQALEGGNYILATVEAQTLMDQREQAAQAGFALVGLDAEVTAQLEALVPDLPFRVNSQLADILGSLYPAFETQSGNGSDVVLGTTVTNDGTGTADTGGNTGGTDTGGGGGGGDQTEPAPQPGDGKVWGHSHKPPHGGWHGDKPPK